MLRAVRSEPGCTRSPAPAYEETSPAIRYAQVARHPSIRREPETGIDSRATGCWPQDAGVYLRSRPRTLAVGRPCLLVVRP
jgi:hypothetical protein